MEIRKEKYDWYGNLEFEGEYLNEIIYNRKVYKYNEDDILIYEDEYLNGKRWNVKKFNIIGEFEFILKNRTGNIKDYNDDGKLIFEGDYLNGEKSGKGKEIYKMG